jgi:5-hydroxyisourate hydrolase
LTQVTTHVLDTARGAPAAGVPVRLESVSGVGQEEIGRASTDADGRVREIGRANTDADGRVREIGPDRLPPGTYRLVFDTAAYFAQQRTAGFFPEVAISFTVDGDGQHYHVPLLLSPFGYATYRGS